MKGLILVTGSDGLVGSRFIEISERKNFLHYPKEFELDITKPNDVENIISSYNFSAVVNFAAYTDVDGAEKQRGDENGTCWQINVEGVKNLAEAVKPFKGRIHFIQVSTDMVFSGGEHDPGPYEKNHKPEKNLDKMTWYGFTKQEGERVVKEILDSGFTVLRINYPVRVNFKKKLDFIRKSLELYDKGGLYPLFTDQQISISFIDEVCRALDKIIIDREFGIFHASSKDTTTPHELISVCLEKTRDTKNPIQGTTLEEFLKKTGSPSYRYPNFGGLKVDFTEDALGIKFSRWKEIVEKLVEQGLGK